MNRKALIACAVVGAGLLGWLMLSGRKTEGASATIYHRERADGVDDRLQAFLDLWAANGGFDLVVLPKGGLRTDEAEQEALFKAGTSKAPTLGETPHGHAGAVDVAPYIDGEVPWDRWDLFQQIGEMGKSVGLKWGGDFSSLKDGPHLEVPDWRELPMPGGYA